MLRGCVGGSRPVAPKACHRCCVNNHAATLLEHNVDGLAHGAHRAIHVDLHHALVDIIRKLANGHHLVHDTRIVVKDIQSTKLLHHMINHGLHLLLAGNIQLVGDDFPLQISCVLSQFLQSFFTPGGGNHRCPFFSKEPGSLPSYA